MRIPTAMLLLAFGCGPAPSPSEPTGNPAGGAPSAPSPGPATTLIGECGYTFGKTQAIETASSRMLPPNGGVTDATSVVTILARTSAPGAVSIAYETGVASCLLATFPKSIVMDGVGEDSSGRDFVGVIPAVKGGTHVCWKITTTACQAALSNPPAGTISFDYTTK